ncbi:MAG: hypothetical protein LBM59_00010 [Ruminococcus sp.]|jgi:hypothetical protein|nr:hypothetical protein [Ruminococcus sp.]
MKYFEDDSHTIPDYIKKMPPEEVERLADKYMKQFHGESTLKHKKQKAIA